MTLIHEMQQLLSDNMIFSWAARGMGNVLFVADDGLVTVQYPGGRSPTTFLLDDNMRLRKKHGRIFLEDLKGIK